MKKMRKIFCSLLCVLGISLPLSAVAAAPEETVEVFDEQVGSSTEEDMNESAYRWAFYTGDFGLQSADHLGGNPIDSMIMFIRGPHGRIVKNAQVVTTVIDPAGRQEMSRAYPFKGGYMVAVNQLPAGKYRLETEVVTDGQLFTDEFMFYKS